jgi:hypothetical protein
MAEHMLVSQEEICSMDLDFKKKSRRTKTFEAYFLLPSKNINWPMSRITLKH